MKKNFNFNNNLYQGGIGGGGDSIQNAAFATEYDETDALLGNEQNSFMNSNSRSTYLFNNPGKQNALPQQKQRNVILI